MLPRLDAAGDADGSPVGASAGAARSPTLARDADAADRALRRPELTIGAFGLDGLAWTYVGTRLPELGAPGPGGDRRAAGEVAPDAQDLLDTVRRACLVHSDLNPKNLLVDPDTLALTGVLDWEFAHAGHPCTDLGNLLRFDRDPAFADGRAGGVRRALGGTPPEDAAGRWPGRPTCGRSSTSRPGDGENPVADAAHDRLLRAIARDGIRACTRLAERRREPPLSVAACKSVGTRSRRVVLSIAPEVCLRPRRSGLTLAIDAGTSAGSSAATSR